MKKVIRLKVIYRQQQKDVEKTKRANKRLKVVCLDNLLIRIHILLLLRSIHVSR